MISEQKQQAIYQNGTIIQKMTSSLHQKHSQSFHFFQARIINQILQCNHHSLPYIELNDVRAYTDTTEFLRRVYHYRTQTGRSEIEHRIKLCSEFYSKAIPLAHQYPMMVITNTQSLFLKRNRRLKKIQAGEGSSDETEKQDEEYVDFYELQSFDFLEELDHSSLQGDNQSSVDIQSYDSDIYDCYQSPFNEQSSIPDKLDLKNINEQSLTHIVLDLIPQKQQLKQQKTHSSQTVALGGSNKDHSATVVPIQAQDSFKTSARRSNLSKYLNIIQDMRKFGVNNFEKSIGEQNSSTSHSKIKAIMDSERTVLDNNRKKIRQKAEQLLRRVKQTDGFDV